MLEGNLGSKLCLIQMKNDTKYIDKIFGIGRINSDILQIFVMEEIDLGYQIRWLFKK